MLLDEEALDLRAPALYLRAPAIDLLSGVAARRAVDLELASSEQMKLFLWFGARAATSGKTAPCVWGGRGAGVQKS